MLRCKSCGAEHQMLDPAFARPDAYVALEADERALYAKATDDTCRLALPHSPERFFIRGTLPVQVEGVDEGLHWGLWIEVDAKSFERVLELWSDENQRQEPPFTGVLANEIPLSPPTVGLPVYMRLTGPTTRPEFGFVDTTSHPFAVECRGGVTMHRAAEWIDEASRA